MEIKTGMREFKRDQPENIYKNSGNIKLNQDLDPSNKNNTDIIYKENVPKNRLLYLLMIGIIMMLFYFITNAQNKNTFVFTHANVVPMNKEIVLANYDLLINEGKIIDMGPSSSLKIPQGSTIIDSEGKYLIPALSDMHVHLEGDAWNIMYPPESKFTESDLNFSDILFLYIANGITTIDVLFAFPEHIVLREKIENNEMLGPRLVLSRMIDTAGKGWPSPIGTKINNAGEAKNAVIEMHQQGYDRVKVYSFLTKEAYDTILVTAEKLKIPVDGHIPLSASVEEVLSGGQQMIAHVEEIMKFAKKYDADQIEYYSSLAAKSNVWITSALILNRNLNTLLQDSVSQFSKPGTEYLHPMAYDLWSYLYRFIYKPIPAKNKQEMIDGYNNFQKPFTHEFYKKGGKLLIGTDALVPSTLPGFSLHDELEELVDAGLSPYEALKVSTTNTYEFLGELDIAGTIETGKTANLVLLDENPLERITNTRKIAGVMTQKKWISKSNIDERMKEIKVSYECIRNNRQKQ